MIASTTDAGAYVFTGGTFANADIVVLGSGAALTSGANGGDLSLTTAPSLNGTELLKALTDGTAADTYIAIAAASASNQAYLLDYQGGNAYPYHANDADASGTFVATSYAVLV